MVMRVDCIVSALEAAEQTLEGDRSFYKVALTPQGLPFSQALAGELAQKQSLLLLCGRYEGFDDRVHHFVDSEISLGDFVLNGGEVAAMAVIEATVRLLPGVLGNQSSLCAESFSESLGGLLEYPHYTRPEEFRGHRVPDVLKTGDHQKIDQWRQEQAEHRTRARRPDLSQASSKARGKA
jgi:tRNA (guanine37-N1)-methyltransferase